MVKKVKKTVRRKTRKPLRMTKFDRLVSTTIQNNAHLSTTDVSRKSTVIECEQDVRELQITELTAKLADVRRQKSDADAVLFGLGVVISRR